MAEKESSRPDGRKQFLTVMHPDLIKAVKKAALDEGKPAYVLVEDAVCALLGIPNPNK
jgi:hypothetical protein